MSSKHIFKKNLLKLILIATFIGSVPAFAQKNTQEYLPAKKLELNIDDNTNLKNISKKYLDTLAEYDSFVRSIVNKYYISDVKEIYNFYNIKRDPPKYGFKSRTNEFVYFDCEGAIYKSDVDSVYFYSSCSEEKFKRYVTYFKKRQRDLKEELSERIHHSIKHEAAHAFYCNLKKDIGIKDFPKIKQNSPSVLENIQYNLIEEGIAEYMAYKGKLTESAKRLSDENFKEMIEKEDEFYLYQLGFILVKPILDIDFEKGIIELMRNSLTTKDLKDLPGYRNKRIEKILEE